MPMFTARTRVGGTANKPDADTIFWAWHTDHPGSSVAVYYANEKIVKLIETARTDRHFTENTYYLRNGQLCYVKNRQVHCPALAQAHAWRNATLPCTKATDCYFRGTYYFAQDSCIAQQERGNRQWLPYYEIPGTGGRHAGIPEFFPLQAARYVAVFKKPPVRKP